MNTAISSIMLPPAEMAISLVQNIDLYHYRPKGAPEVLDTFSLLSHRPTQHQEKQQHGPQIKATKDIEVKDTHDRMILDDHDHDDFDLDMENQEWMIIEEAAEHFDLEMGEHQQWMQEEELADLDMEDTQDWMIIDDEEEMVVCIKMDWQHEKYFVLKDNKLLARPIDRLSVACNAMEI